MFTTVVLLAGFGVMIISSFPPNQRFCLLGVGLIGWALVADLLLLPALLWLAYAGQAEEEKCLS